MRFRQSWALENIISKPVWEAKGRCGRHPGVGCWLWAGVSRVEDAAPAWVPESIPPPLAPGAGMEQSLCLGSPKAQWRPEVASGSGRTRGKEGEPDKVSGTKDKWE